MTLCDFSNELAVAKAQHYENTLWISIKTTLKAPFSLSQMTKYKGIHHYTFLKNLTGINLRRLIPTFQME